MIFFLVVSLLLSFLGSCTASPLLKRVAADQQPITQPVYNNLVRYAQFSSAAYLTICVPNGATLVQTINNANTATGGYIAQVPGTHEIIVAFRGSTNAADFIEDVNATMVPFTVPGAATEECSGCFVHGGFFNNWNSVSSQVISTVQGLLQKTPGAPVTVTGHSLGASLASLAGASLQTLGMNTTVYTYGQPRTGNPAYADYVDKILPPFERMFRTTHSDDSVPQSVPLISGFRHHSTEFWQNDPSSVTTVVRCMGQEPDDCNNAAASAIAVNIAAHIQYMGILMGTPSGCL